MSGLPLHNRHNNTATPYICVWIYTCLLIHLLMKNENLNNTKSCVVSRGCVANGQISPQFEFRVPEFPSYTLPGEQPVQLNTVPIYICVYACLLLIPSLRIFDLINNIILFTCSVVHSPEPGNHPFHPFCDSFDNVTGFSIYTRIYACACLFPF